MALLDGVTETEVLAPAGGGGHSDGGCCPGGPAEEEMDETPLELPVGDTEPEPSLLEGPTDVEPGGEAADTTEGRGQGHFYLHASFENFKDFLHFLEVAIILILVILTLKTRDNVKRMNVYWL